jgi:putative transposase
VKKSKFKDSQIVELIKHAEAGEPMASLCREAGINSATFSQMAKQVRRHGCIDASAGRRTNAMFGIPLTVNGAAPRVRSNVS